MSDSVKLYNLEQRNYPNSRGDTFRCVQIFECWVCGAFSNRVVMGGYPGYGVRTCCPNSSDCWHHVLEHKLQWLGKPHPSDYKASLQQEIETFREKYRGRITNDLAGDLDLTKPKRGMTNTQSIRDGSFCEHWFGTGSYDEASIERAEASIRKATEQQPDPEFEALIAKENSYVKAHARRDFYGRNLQVHLFPKDDSGPRLFEGGERGDQALLNVRRAGDIADIVSNTPRLLARLREFKGIKIP